MEGKKLGIKILAGTLVIATIMSVTAGYVNQSKANEKDSYQWSTVEGEVEDDYLCTQILHENMDRLAYMTEEEAMELFTSEEYSRQFDAMLKNLFEEDLTTVYRGEGDGNTPSADLGTYPGEEAEKKGKFKEKCKEIRSKIDEYVDMIIEKFPESLKTFFKDKLANTIKNTILDFCDAYEQDNSFKGAKEKLDEISKDSKIPKGLIEVIVDIFVDMLQTFIERPEGMTDIKDCEISIDEANNVTITYNGEAMKDSNYNKTYESSFKFVKATEEEITNNPSIILELAENMRTKEDNDDEFAEIKKRNPNAVPKEYTYEKYIYKYFEKWTIKGKNEFYGYKFIEKSRPATMDEFIKRK